MWLKTESMENLMKIEHLPEGLVVKFANHYTTLGAILESRVITYFMIPEQI